jgi:hypothetical protein
MFLQPTRSECILFVVEKGGRREKESLVVVWIYLRYAIVHFLYLLRPATLTLSHIDGIIAKNYYLSLMGVGFSLFVSLCVLCVARSPPFYSSEKPSYYFNGFRFE